MARMRGEYLNPPTLPPIAIDPESAPRYKITFPAQYIAHVISALELYTHPMRYDGYDYTAIETTIDAMHAIIQTLREDTMDCTQVDPCIEQNSLVSSLRSAAQQTTSAAESAAGANALAAYSAAGNDPFVYNPAMPAQYTNGTPDSDKLLCMAALAFSAEFARKIYNYSETMLGLSNFVLGFGGLIANLTQYLPTWLGSILNYVVLPLVGVTYNEYLQIKSAAQDITAIRSLACQLSTLFDGTPVSYTDYESVIDAIVITGGTDNENELAYRAQLWLKNERAFLYWIDTVALIQQADPALYEDCACVTSEITYDYRAGQFGSFIYGTNWGTYAPAIGYRYYNGQFWDRSGVDHPAIGGVTINEFRLYQYRTVSTGYGANPAVDLYFYDSSGTLLRRIQNTWSGLETYQGITFKRFDTGTPIVGVDRIQIRQVSINSSAVGSWVVYGWGYS